MGTFLLSEFLKKPILHRGLIERMIREYLVTLINTGLRLTITI